MRTPPVGSVRCAQCSSSIAPPFTFSFAFQPIVDMRARCIFSYEALVRGPQGEPAGWVLEQVDESNRYRFDQACRVGAIRLAAKLGMTTKLNINFMPNAVYAAETCIRTTLAAAARYAFPIERLIFEALESAEFGDPSRLTEILSEYKRFGFLTAVDDFGAGFRELNALAAFQPDLLKIDIELIRAIDMSKPRQAIVHGLIVMCRELNVRILAEGVETFAEFGWLANSGVDLFQGFLFARPAFEALPEVRFEDFVRS